MVKNIGNLGNPQNLLFHVLEIINFPGDKETFIQEFLELCLQKGINDLCNTLSPNIKEVALAQLKTAQTIEEAEPILHNYFSNEQYQEALYNATVFLLQDYLKKMKQYISPQQQEELKKYAEEVLS